MDEHHQAELQRILQNRKNRGVTPAAVTPLTLNPRDQPPPSNILLRDASPAPRLVPSLSYGPDSRSGSLQPVLPAQPDAMESVARPPFPMQQPTLAAYENAVPQPILRHSSTLRSGSMVPQPRAASSTANIGMSELSGISGQAHNDIVPQAAAVMLQHPSAPSMEAMMRRGSFDNFRNNPILVSTNIRPYTATNASRVLQASTKQLSAASAIPHTAAPLSPPRHTSPRPQRDAVGAIVESPAALTMSAVAAASFSKPNPFRGQSFEEFCEAPQYDRHVPVSAVVPQLNRQFKAPSPIAAAMSVPQDGNPPLFDPQQALTVLVQGDWFLKWTRIESAHRRYVWLDLSRGVISWAKSRDSSFFLQKSIKLEDIMDIKPLCVVDDTSGRSFYQLVVSSLDRTLKIGTELRDKFDVWFDTLQRLCEAQRNFTNAYTGRHAAIQRIASAGEFVRRTVESASTE